MKIICGLLSPSNGTVESMYEYQQNTLELERNSGYLPENNPLYPDLYVEEYLHYVAGLI